MFNIRIRVIEPGPSPDYAKLPLALRQQAESEIPTKTIADAMQAENNLKKSPLVFFSDYWTLHSPLPQCASIPVHNLSIDLETGQASITNKLVLVPPPKSVLPIQLTPLQTLYVIVPQFEVQTPEMSCLEAGFAALTGKNAFPSKADLAASFDQFKQSITALRTAGLKSLLQKLIRFSPKKVVIPGYPKPQRATRILLLTMMALYLDPGSLNPDTQTFVRGSEALFKRLLISGLEDSYLSPKNLSAAVSLITSALITKHCGTQYRLPTSILQSFFALGLHIMQVHDFTV